MLRTIILLCASNLDPSACTPETAIDVMSFPPDRAAICSPIAAQMTVARTALKPEPGRSYIKSLCERVREASR